MAHLIMIEPSPTSLEISETFLIRNESTTTFQDSANGTAQFYPPKAAGDKVQVSVTPPTQMTIQRHAEKAAKPGSFKIDYPVRPGETRFDMHYTLPASETFSAKVVPGDRPTTVVTPLSVHLPATASRSRRRAGGAGPPVSKSPAPSFEVKIEGTGSIREPAEQRRCAGGRHRPAQDHGNPGRDLRPNVLGAGPDLRNSGAGRHTALPQGRGVTAKHERARDCRRLEILRRLSGPPRRGAEHRARLDPGSAGPQRRGQDHSAADHRRTFPALARVGQDSRRRKPASRPRGDASAFWDTASRSTTSSRRSKI